MPDPPVVANPVRAAQPLSVDAAAPPAVAASSPRRD